MSESFLRQACNQATGTEARRLVPHPCRRATVARVGGGLRGGQEDGACLFGVTLRPRGPAGADRLVVAEEGWPQCSISSEIMAICMEEGFDDLDAPPAKVNGADVPMPYAANLEKLALPNADEVVAAAKAVLYV